VAALVFWVEDRRRGRGDDERVWIVVAGVLVGGAIMMRLGTWLQHVDLRANATLAEQWVYGNRSILGGLVGAYAGAHLAKRLIGYRERTGDLFAPAVALGMAVGRVGCLLTELPGTPTEAGWGVSLSAEQAARVGGETGVALHPSFAYEIVFHLAAFAVLWGWLRFQPIAAGETLTCISAPTASFDSLSSSCVATRLRLPDSPDRSCSCCARCRLCWQDSLTCSDTDHFGSAYRS